MKIWQEKKSNVVYITFLDRKIIKDNQNVLSPLSTTAIVVGW